LRKLGNGVCGRQDQPARRTVKIERDCSIQTPVTSPPFTWSPRFVPDQQTLLAAWPPQRSAPVLVVCDGGPAKVLNRRWITVSRIAVGPVRRRLRHLIRPQGAHNNAGPPPHCRSLTVGGYTHRERPAQYARVAARKSMRIALATLDHLPKESPKLLTARAVRSALES
jgi:hypothetical protein